MRGIVQVDRWEIVVPTHSYAVVLRHRSPESVGVVMSPEPPGNFNIERDVPDEGVNNINGVPSLSTLLSLGVSATRTDVFSKDNSVKPVLMADCFALRGAPCSL
jgi:hypothetical protein